jgi:hypothetical protein
MTPLPFNVGRGQIYRAPSNMGMGSKGISVPLGLSLLTSAGHAAGELFRRQPQSALVISPRPV